jgi:NAD(P)-dependent dehydrogenase (short-subunit alcohol dehydrogenase family)
VSHTILPFAGKTIVVSGASSGIGRAVAVHLSKHGAGLVLIGRNKGRLEETARMAGGKCEILPLDLNNHSEILPAIRNVREVVGRIYGLCHAAGIVETVPLSGATLDHHNAMMQVNYLAGMELARAVSRRDVIEDGGGSLVFVSSIYAVIGKPGQIAYSASKGAVNAGARAMAIELARRNIRVNVVSPGMVETEMTTQAFSRLSADQIQRLRDSHPLGFGSAEDVAHAAGFLLSPASKWITATDLIVDGGCSAQ